MKSVRIILLLFIITIFIFLSPGCGLSPAPKKAIVKVIPHTISISSLDKKTKITLKRIVIKSIILNKFMKANIFVPPGYTKAKKYSVRFLENISTRILNIS